ncbi:hypothetical protein PR202_ga05753 [Eleusine coracana subsp. coracana]|uniref:Uncharacterized protein n=1 Tax=Eleusine coracana subsp. coracana TaxID=191504 RepID=A0AAV5BT18_ELECO|nr:hypothetical protein PR202_ga05753 [Eleusine coracana subsp. coracana]
MASIHAAVAVMFLVAAFLPCNDATASVVCYGNEASKYRVLNLTTTATDKNGYFMVLVYDVGMFDTRSCRVYLRSSPTPLCAAPVVPSNVKLGLTLVKEPGRAPLPKGARAAYHSKAALMYGPGAAGKCPPSY